MRDMGHCFMSAEDFDEEYEPFYDFSGTYEESWVGKKLDDFDLSEEPTADPAAEPCEAQEENKKRGLAPMPEPVPEDDEWEDCDMEDGDGAGAGDSNSSSFQMVSEGKSHSESFDMLSKDISEEDREKLEAIQAMSE